MSASLPAFFRSLRWLRGLNTLGVGCALGAAVGVWFGNHSVGNCFSEPTALGTALSTLSVGTLWVAVLRRLKDPHRLRSSILVSIPLAVLNSTLAFVLVQQPPGLLEALSSFLGGLLLSATFGVIFWVPGLMFTLLVFGLPIAWSQQQARKGLAGEERGEAVLGGIVVLLSVLALAMGVERAPSSQRHLAEMQDDLLESPPAGGPPSRRGPDSEASWALAAMSASGLLLGSTALALSWQRERRRRRFVSDAQDGKIQGYRVDDTTEGKVLVRVAIPGSEAYRALTMEDEELFALDEQGLATRPAQQLEDGEARG
jgi:hypothetical protein